jgi:thiazolylpeptide-type bacteriocin precursor
MNTFAPTVSPFDGIDFTDLGLEVLDISEIHDAVALPETGASSGSSSCDSRSTCGSTSTCCV